MKYTSAAAGKRIKALEEEKELVLSREAELCTYVRAVGEEMDAPAYDFLATRDEVTRIDAEALRIRHALHRFNLETVLPNSKITIDEALVLMAQLGKEKQLLKDMRARLPRKRVDANWTGSASIEYEYANYDIKQAEERYAAVAQRISDLQMEIDYANQTVQFKV